jgi:hypothetical protein
MKRTLIAFALFTVAIVLAQQVGAQPFRMGNTKKGKDTLLAKGAATGFNNQPSAEQIAFFEKKIRPVLVDKCYKCHAADSEKVKAELYLDTREGVRKGGESGAAIVPGNPARSLLIRAIRFKDESMQMPPKAKLPDEVIADFEAWVKMGAPDPRDGGRKASENRIDYEKGRQFWAFQKPKPSAIRDIDAIILDGLKAKSLTPVGAAEKRTLIRRVYFDLTGLPPTGEQVEAYLADSSPKAFEKVVDRLLASPRFGERWARHWLDLARYAESTGKTVNFNYPHAWRYRDYVIGALNADKPYDQFIREQLAGDLLPTNDPKLKAERLIATGFLAIGPKTLNERNGTQFELDLADEQIEVTTQAFLGLTAACARCHDHKFDPISQKDYYALAGIFRSTETCYGTVRFINAQRVSPLINLPDGSAPTAVEKLTAAERTRIESQIQSLQDSMKNVKPDQQIQRLFASGQISLLNAKLADYDSEGVPKLEAMGVRDKPSGRSFQPKGRPGFAGFAFTGTRNIADSPIYVRGEVDKPGDVVPRGVLQVMATPVRIPNSQSGRLELANWIASKDNPLTSRVQVNRVWQHLFGRGIVPTPDNFGGAGRLPSNPALLDDLALTFVDDGWSIKKLIRRIVLTQAYQRDSTIDEKCFQADPENDLLWRMTPRRLDGEALRDSMLATSGLLNTTPPVGSVVAKAGEGPTSRPRLGGAAINSAVNDPRNNHRSVYLPVIRDNLPEAMSLFDAADPSLVIAERPTTTVPAQGLFLLNSSFVLRAADFAAEKLMKDTTTDTERIRAAYLNFFGRPPVEKELKDAEGFLAAFRAAAKKERTSARLLERETWAAFTQAMMGSAEFQYRK